MAPGVKQSLFQKVQLWCCVCSKGLRGCPRWSQTPRRPSGGRPISDVEAKRTLSGGGHALTPPEEWRLALPPHTWEWGRCRVLATFVQSRWPWLHHVRGWGRHLNHSPGSFHLRFASFSYKSFSLILLSRASLLHWFPVTCRNYSVVSLPHHMADESCSF